MKSLKKILAVAVMAASAQSAFAFWDTGVDTVNKSGVNNGEAILTIWDAAAQKSFSQDLGVRYSDLFSGAAFNNQTITLDATALSVFGGNFSGLSWSVSAANSHVKNGSANAYAGAGYIYSFNTGDVITTPPGIGTNISTIWGTFNPYATNLGWSNAAVPGNQATSGTAAGSGATGYQSEWIDGVTSFNAFGSVASALNLWSINYNNNTGSQGATHNLGKLSLDLVGGKLTFNSASTPEVPVPGAAWLMGSALVGLAGVGRSRKQRA